jgi:hypothetical protein
MTEKIDIRAKDIFRNKEGSCIVIGSILMDNQKSNYVITECWDFTMQEKTLIQKIQL